MRPPTVALAALLLLAAPAARAAPTCLNLSGDTVRCGTRGAMPVGWTPSPQQLAEWRQAKAPGPSANELLGTAIGIGLLFALIALLPEFDGRRADDWDRQEEDREPR